MKLTARSLVFASVLPFAAATSHAADLNAPMVMPTKAPSYVNPYAIWTGFYGGLQIGYGWATENETRVNANGFFPVGFASSTKISGVEGGGQLGFNYEINNWVLGIEGDIGAADLTGSSTYTNVTGGAGTATINHTGQWIDDVTGRLGYAWGPWLVYGKGGWAWTHGTGNTTDSATPGTTSGSATFDGWTAGAGVEWMFVRNWSAKLEYQHFDFGSHQETDNAGGIFNNSTKADLVKIGLNYHFWTW